MKALLLLIAILSFSAFAQDPKAYLASFDSKVYSLKTKGVKDFVVDIESSRLTKQMNEQMVFGNVKKLVFRVYWTANPERLAIEIIGLPEGFKEIKEELKVSIMSMLDNLLPVPMHDKFATYQITQKGNGKEFVAQDKTGIALVPTYILKFDARDALAEIIGQKPVGSMQAVYKYEKPSLGEGKFVLISHTTTSSENGQSLVSKKELSYGTSQGITILSRVDISTEQKWNDPDAKPLVVSESLEFNNYKINNGDALNYFLGDASPK